MPILVPISGATEEAVAVTTLYPVYGSIDIATSHVVDTVNMSADIISGDSFMILADVLNEALSGPIRAGFGYEQVDAELKINGSVVEIKSFDYEVPSGKLGAILNVELAKADPTLVPAGASIEFNLIFTTDGSSTRYTLLKNGKLQGRDYTISFKGDKGGGRPTDKVTFSALDIISDKFGLAPRRPVTMYDPSRVKYDQVYTRSDQQVRDQNYGRIVPQIEPVYGLTMMAVLNRAYTNSGGFGFMGHVPDLPPALLALLTNADSNQTGTGFDAVITNIPDYRVRRADFSLEAGWHDGAQPVVAMYDPLYYVYNNKLYIMYMDRALPHGITSRVIPLWEHKSLSEKQQYRQDSNAVLVTYQYDGNDPFEDAVSLKAHRDEFTEEPVEEQGTLGHAGYYKTVVRRWDRKFYMTDQPDNILDTVPLSSDTTTTQSVVWYDEDGNPVWMTDAVTHQETIDYTYEGDLKVGHERTVKAALMNPAHFRLESLSIVEVETCNQSWTEDPNNPGVKLLDRVQIDTRGICYYDPDGPETLADDSATVIFRYLPALLAQRSGIIQSSWLLTGLVPVKSIRKTLQNMKGNALDMEVLERDLLNNTLQRSYVDPITGGTKNDAFEAKHREVLLRDLVSEAEIGARIPTPKNCYELPRQMALDLGATTLKRLKDPLMTMPLEFAGVDLGVVQGSVIRGEKRSGETANYFVTGYGYTGVNLGKTGHRVSQKCDAIELLALS